MKTIYLKTIILISIGMLFTIPVTASYQFYGTLLNPDGSPMANTNIVVCKNGILMGGTEYNCWRMNLGRSYATTDSSGNYMTGFAPWEQQPTVNGAFQIRRINADTTETFLEEKSLTPSDFEDLGNNEYRYQWNLGGTSIPEFPTVALPVIAVIGLMFLFQRRKGN